MKQNLSKNGTEQNGTGNRPKNTKVRNKSAGMNKKT